MSAMGLYCLLEEHPEYTIVLDDIGSLFDQRFALQILLAALGGKPGFPRPITYTIKEKSQSFEFNGTVIAISNVRFRRDPLTDAVVSRIPDLEHNPSDEQIAAFMRSQAQKGYEDLYTHRVPCGGGICYRGESAERFPARPAFDGTGLAELPFCETWQRPTIVARTVYVERENRLP
jgi:hypothetical protein